MLPPTPPPIVLPQGMHDSGEFPLSDVRIIFRDSLGSWFRRHYWVSLCSFLLRGAISRPGESAAVLRVQLGITFYLPGASSWWPELSAISGVEHFFIFPTRLARLPLSSEQAYSLSRGTSYSSATRQVTWAGLPFFPPSSLDPSMDVGPGSLGEGDSLPCAPGISQVSFFSPLF